GHVVPACRGPQRWRAARDRGAPGRRRLPVLLRRRAHGERGGAVGRLWRAVRGRGREGRWCCGAAWGGTAVALSRLSRERGAVAGRGGGDGARPPVDGEGLEPGRGLSGARRLPRVPQAALAGWVAAVAGDVARVGAGRQGGVRSGGRAADGPGTRARL